MNTMNPVVDWYFSKNKSWQKEIETLRAIVLECGLTGDGIIVAVQSFTRSGLVKLSQSK